MRSKPYREVHPLELLRLLRRYGPVHNSMFSELQNRENVRITKTALRTLRKRGWLFPRIDFGWVLTKEGNAKAAAAAKENGVG